ncbi:hypothetical protein MGU_10200 [Metarhizium guizhouense ARSEF 977]|uniref:Uncharacterized protein n=1 Tax=Metarhizium guizhouense (strain ARSEF 977) TaxID=1276136 RepID=A0A0B4GYA0_METGA|nr:hypothetical protein MGU_10200 [Metarhizium guizhouense ARSEF 977]
MKYSLAIFAVFASGSLAGPTAESSLWSPDTKRKLCEPFNGNKKVCADVINGCLQKEGRNPGHVLKCVHDTAQRPWIKESLLCTAEEKLEEYKLTEQQCRREVRACVESSPNAQNFDPIAKCVDDKFSKSDSDLDLSLLDLTPHDKDKPSPTTSRQCTYEWTELGKPGVKKTSTVSCSEYDAKLCFDCRSRRPEGCDPCDQCTGHCEG